MTDDRSEIEAQLPLTPLSFHILLGLADTPRHGYGIIKEIDARTEGAMRPRTGTLYTALGRLEGDGLIEETEDRPDPEEDDRRRRYYQLTAAGRAAVRAEAARLDRLVDVAREKNLLPLPGSGTGR